MAFEFQHYDPSKPRMVTSFKGNQKLIFEGYRYNIHHIVPAKGVKTWRCVCAKKLTSQRSWCKGRAETWDNDTQGLSKGEHNHDPEHTNAEQEFFKSQLILAAISNPSANLNDLIDEATTYLSPGVSFGTRESMKKSLTVARKAAENGGFKLKCYKNSTGSIGISTIERAAGRQKTGKGQQKTEKEPPPTMVNGDDDMLQHDQKQKNQQSAGSKRKAGTPQKQQQQQANQVNQFEDNQIPQQQLTSMDNISALINQFTNGVIGGGKTAASASTFLGGFTPSATTNQPVAKKRLLSTGKATPSGTTVISSPSDFNDSGICMEALSADQNRRPANSAGGNKRSGGNSMRKKGVAAPQQACQPSQQKGMSPQDLFSAIISESSNLTQQLQNTNSPSTPSFLLNMSGNSSTSPSSFLSSSNFSNNSVGNNSASSLLMPPTTTSNFINNSGAPSFDLNSFGNGTFSGSDANGSALLAAAMAIQFHAALNGNSPTINMQIPQSQQQHKQQSGGNNVHAKTNIIESNSNQKHPRNALPLASSTERRTPTSPISFVSNGGTPGSNNVVKQKKTERINNIFNKLSTKAAAAASLTTNSTSLEHFQAESKDVSSSAKSSSASSGGGDVSTNGSTPPLSPVTSSASEKKVFASTEIQTDISFPLVPSQSQKVENHSGGELLELFGAGNDIRLSGCLRNLGNKSPSLDAEKRCECRVIRVCCCSDSTNCKRRTIERSTTLDSAENDDGSNIVNCFTPCTSPTDALSPSHSIVTVTADEARNVSPPNLGQSTIVAIKTEPLTTFEKPTSNPTISIKEEEEDENSGRVEVANMKGSGGNTLRMPTLSSSAC